MVSTIVDDDGHPTAQQPQPQPPLIPPSDPASREAARRKDIEQAVKHSAGATAPSSSAAYSTTATSKVRNQTYPQTPGGSNSSSSAASLPSPSSLSAELADGASAITSSAADAGPQATEPGSSPSTRPSPKGAATSTDSSSSSSERTAPSTTPASPSSSSRDGQQEPSSSSSSSSPPHASARRSLRTSSSHSDLSSAAISAPYISSQTTTNSAHHHGGGHGHHSYNNHSSSSSHNHSAGPSSSSSSTNHNNNHGHSTVVPAYPYNVSMSPFIPGVTSSRQDSYFEQHVPDDSNVQTRLPSICVDYLSHDWQEDDVWTSWKAMTKHKSEIANGVRLENASWRTWAKQRGKLKTISPETLNWLKDSDVTWLYGPLHTAVEPVPAPKAATAEDYLGLDKSTGKKRRPEITVKPILKHRSLSEILSVPASGASSPVNEGSHSYNNSEDDEHYYHSRDEDESSEEEDGGDDARASAAGHHGHRSPHGPSHLQHSESAFSSGSSSSSSTSSATHSPSSSHETTPRGERSQSPTSGEPRHDKPARPKAPKAKSDSSLTGEKKVRRKRHGSSGSPSRSALPANARGHGSGEHASSSDATASGSSSARARRASHDNLHHHDSAHHDLPSDHHANSRRASSHERHRKDSHESHQRGSGSFHSQHHPLKRKHITFNHRVEQCISVDVDEDAVARSQSMSGNKRGNGDHQQPYSNSLQRYGGSTVGGSGRQSSSSSGSTSSSSDDDDDEEVLTFRSSSPRSPTFMKPFLVSPSDPNGPGKPGPGGQDNKQGGGGFGLSGQFHGPHSDKYKYLNDMHTIAKLEPTTLKESELLPGPTPIVVFEDGKVTALYGTEEDYEIDEDEHLMGEFDLDELRRTSSRNSEVIEDDEDEDEDEDDQEEEEDEDVDDGGAGAAAAQTGKDDQRPGTIPLSAVPKSVVGGPVVASPSTVDKEPASTSDRFEDPNASLVNAQGVGKGKTDYFGGPETALADGYDARTSNATQSKYGAMASSTIPDYTRGVPAGQMQATNNNVINVSQASTPSTISPAMSPSTELPFGLSSSPRTAGGIPTKSILKKQRESTSSEYYPPMPPASTRASRAHAAMFADDGEEIVASPRGRSSFGAAESQNGQAGANSTNDAVTATPSGSASSPAANYNNSTTANHSEPSRGRSISRGSSSSSLIDRANSGTSGTGTSDPYSASRTRSSGGHSISPVPSYSPPHTVPLNQLGAGTAVLHSQPVDIPRGRVVHSTKPSARRESLYDSSDDEDTRALRERGTNLDDDGDQQVAATMDVQGDAGKTQLDGTGGDDVVHFVRRNQSPASAAASSNALKHAHRTAFDDDDSHDTYLDSSTSPTDEAVNTDRQDEEGFEFRPTSTAADVGRRNADLRDNATVVLPKHSPAMNNVDPSHADEGERRKELSFAGSAGAARGPSATQPTHTHSRNETSTRRRGLYLGPDEQDEDGDDDDDAEALFDSPSMPSSPVFMSNSNLPGLAANASDAGLKPGQLPGNRQDDPGRVTLQWADGDQPALHRRRSGSGSDAQEGSSSSSAARNSLLRNLVYSNPAVSSETKAAQHRSQQPPYKANPRGGKARQQSSQDSRTVPNNDSEGDLSDPANNGYSYGYGFDDDDDPDDGANRGYVGRAVDLVSALWNVGSGMLWRPSGQQQQQSEDARQERNP